MNKISIRSKGDLFLIMIEQKNKTAAEEHFRLPVEFLLREVKGEERLA